MIKKNQTASVNFIAKSLLEENYFAYITHEDRNAWDEWAVKNRRISLLENFSELDENQELAARKAKYLQFAILNVRYKNESLAQKDLVNKAESLLRKSIHNPIMLPYFINNFDDSLLKHSARVTYLTILFIMAHPALVSLDNTQALIFSSIIHELKGDPATSFNPNSYENTIEVLQKNKMIFPESVVNIIQSHGELYKEKRKTSSNIALEIFLLVNRFDHIYLTATQNPGRKIRLEKTLEILNGIAESFEGTVFEYFKDYIFHIDYIV